VKRFFLAAVASLCLSRPGAAELPPEEKILVEKGVTALYNLDYAAARQNFEALKTQYPQSAIGPYAMTTALWWELTNEFDENNPDLEKEFLAAADATVKFARESVKRGDPDGMERLCLGGALGLKSRWEAIEGKWLKAYVHGKQAYKLQEEAIRVNPELYDAYLGVGIFHYYTATLPSMIRALAWVVAVKGDREKGLKEIHQAMEKGLFSRTAAQLFLIGINNNKEKNYAEAHRLVQAGRKEFPQSSFYHLIEMMTLENLKDWAALRREAEDYLARIQNGEPSYRKTYFHRGYFLLGNSHLGAGEYATAVSTYDKILQVFPNQDRWISWTYLNRGKAHEALGDNDAAMKDYREVLKRRDVWQLHDKAEEQIAALKKKK